MSRKVSVDIHPYVRQAFLGRRVQMGRGTTAQRRSRKWRQLRRDIHAVLQSHFDARLRAMRLEHYVETDDGQLVEVDLLTWAKWFADIRNRRVALDRVGRHEVSTVMLGIAHGFVDGRPLIYETMTNLDGEWLSGYTNRYASRAEALEGHQEILERVRRVNAVIEEQQKILDGFLDDEGGE